VERVKMAILIQNGEVVKVGSIRGRICYVGTACLALACDQDVPWESANDNVLIDLCSRLDLQISLK
jgi:hypothetical protein